MRLPGLHPAGLFQRNLHPPPTVMDGVSTYLALIFGTLLSSQGTDASFVLTLSGFPPGFSLRSYCLAFPTLSDRFRFRFPRCFPGFRFRVSLSGDSDFIRKSESDFPPLPGWSGHVICPGSRSGGAVNVLERSAPMQIEVPRSGFSCTWWLRPRRRPAGSSACGGRCPRPICPAYGG
jgi:hypothetical protein